MTEQKEEQTALQEPMRVRLHSWIPSLVWIIPIVAAIVGVTLMMHSVLSKGPVITISFSSAEGMEPGKTKVKYKDVDIGMVQSLELTKDLKQVLVQVQLNKSAEGFTATDTRFWVVRPRIATSGVSGLGTLLSGAYIGADAGNAKERKKFFQGLDTPPVITRDSSGRSYVLHTEDLGSLDIGSPVFYRRIKVGQIAAYDLDKNGKGVTLRIFINAPYDKFVTLNSRFWHASGFDMQINGSGFQLHTQSLATVILGGIAFKSADDETVSAPSNTVFRLANDEVDAMQAADGAPETFLLYFNQSLRGLAPGATVDFRGVVLGQVKSISVDYDKQTQDVVMPVLIQIYPSRLGKKLSSGQDTPDLVRKRLEFLIKRGLRGQLRTGNLLTGQLYVELDFFKNAPKESLKMVQNMMVLPTVPNSLDKIQTQIAEITQGLSKVPFAQIGSELKTTLNTLNQTLVSAEQLTKRLNTEVAPEVAAAMKDVRKTLDDASRTLSENAPLQQEVRQTMQELSRTATSVRVLTDYLREHPESLIRGKKEDK